MQCKGPAFLTTNPQVHAAFFMMLFCVCLMSSLRQRPIISEHMWAKLILTNQRYEGVLQLQDRMDDMGRNATWPAVIIKNIVVNPFSIDGCPKATVCIKVWGEIFHFP